MQKILHFFWEMGYNWYSFINDFTKMRSSFFSPVQTLTVLDIATCLDAQFQGGADAIIEGVAPLSIAQKTDISFLHNVRYLGDLEKTQAGAVLIEEKYCDKVPDCVVKIICTSPYRAFGKIAQMLYPLEKSSGEISPLAFIDPSAKIGKNVTIEPFVVVKKGACIGNNCILKAHTVVGENVIVGDDALIFEHVTLSTCIIGKSAYIKSGARIGQSGFGFHMDERGHFDIPQLGCVRIGDDVQIGSNVTIDRGSQFDTIIGHGVRIDNLVQIAHNVEVGDHSVLVAQVGIAGSTKLGKFVVVAGQVGIAGHLSVGNFVKIAAQSGVMRNVEDNAVVAGSPAIHAPDWHRQTIALKNLVKEKKHV